MRNFRLHDGKHGAALTIRVTPRARKNALAGIMDDGTLRVRVAAPPVGGKANAALIEFLAEILSVRKNKIELVAGARGLDKIVSVVGITSAQAEERIRAWLQAQEEETA